MAQLLLAATHLDALYRAWRSVRSQLRTTQWPHLTAELAAVEAAPIKTLRELQRRLRAGEYAFEPKVGYAKRKSGGSRRGITVHGVRDRIVQRALLNTIFTRHRRLRQQLGEIPQILGNPCSFAGVPGRGVPDAIAAARQALKQGAEAFAYSDVKEFFPYVPRANVLEFVRQQVADAEFIQLLEHALETELSNADELTEWLELFPLHDVGVAQGSLLSVLVANLALRHFDARLNSESLTTLRYLDDFLILGPSLNAVQRGFGEAEQQLSYLGLTCYAPGDGSHKADMGEVSAGFDFLGYRVHPDGISPSRQAARKLLRDITRLISRAKQQIREFGQSSGHRRAETTYAQTLVLIDRKIRGWGDVYRIATNRLTFTQLDGQIDRLVSEFRGWVHHQCGFADPRNKRRLLGIALLADTPPAAMPSPPAD